MEAAVGVAAATVTRNTIAIAAIPIGNRPDLKRSVVGIDFVVEGISANCLTAANVP